MSTTKYQGKSHQPTGLSRGASHTDALSTGVSTANNQVDTTGLNPHASHDREKGLGPKSHSHSEDVDSSIDTRTTEYPAGHREALGAQGPSEEGNQCKDPEGRLIGLTSCVIKSQMGSLCQVTDCQV